MRYSMNCRLTVAGAARWGHRPWGGGRIRLAAPFLVHSTTKYVSGHDTSPLELGGGVRRFAVSARLDFPEARVQEKDGLLRREPHLPRDGRWLRSARFWVLALVSASFGGSLLLLLPDRKRAKSLNPKTFVPFTITSREQVSPTSFVLTVEPAAAAEETYAAAWAHGLWSIEVKQPQLQIARDYTPLPPVGGGDDSRSRGTPGPLPAGALRFLLRKIDGGEVSTYLSRLGVGDTVELRGPRLGFDVRRRLGRRAECRPHRRRDRHRAGAAGRRGRAGRPRSGARCDRVDSVGESLARRLRRLSPPRRRSGGGRERKRRRRRGGHGAAARDEEATRRPAATGLPG